MNIAPLGREATLEDLWEVEGRAELIDGEIVPMTPSGHLPVRAAARIWRAGAAQPLHSGTKLLISWTNRWNFAAIGWRKTCRRRK